MNYYKELVEELKRNGLSNGGALGHHSGLYDAAADAIEQLVKERDTAVADLQEWCDKLCYCEVCKHDGKCVKEFCIGASNWEWRGVQG